MTDRERITEILKNYTKKNNISASSVILEEYAEELIANGVILKPCEIGTKVWCIWQPHELWIDDDLFINEAVVIGFTVDENKTKVITSDYFHEAIFTGNRLVDVCYSEEQAEEKLKELNNNAT